MYGMWQWAILAGALLFGGCALGWMLAAPAVAGGWATCAALAIFAIAGWRIVVAEEKRAAA
jgi:hypothetical protein